MQRTAPPTTAMRALAEIFKSAVRNGAPIKDFSWHKSLDSYFLLLFARNIAKYEIIRYVHGTCRLRECRRNEQIEYVSLDSAKKALNDLVYYHKLMLRSCTFFEDYNNTIKK